MRSHIIACFAIIILFLSSSARPACSLTPLQNGGDSLAIDILIEQSKSTTADSALIASSLYQALGLSRKHQLHTKEAEACLALGSFYELHYVNDSAKAYAEKAIALFAAQGNPRGEADAKIVLADVYTTEDSRAAAMALQFESLKYYEGAGDSLEMGTTINRIANSQNYLGHHEDALKQYSRALDIFERLSDYRRQAIVIYNMALIFGEEGDLRKAIRYYRKSEDLDREVGNELGIVETYTTMASTFDELKEWDSAYLYYTKAFEILKNNENTFLLGYNYRQLHQHYNLRGDYRKGVKAGLKSLAIGKRINNVQEISNSSLNLAESYSALGDYKEAFHYFKLYHQLNDSVYNTQNSRIIHDMQARYESEKKEKELALKQADIERQEAMLEEQANIRNMLAAGLVIVLLAAGLIYRGERIKARAYDELSLKSREIENKNEIIEGALKEKEALLKEIHHRVKNNLQVISSILNMQSRSTANPDMLSAIQEGQSRVKAMALIHQKLYQSEQLSEIDFKEYAEDLISHLSSVFQGNNVSGVKNTVTASDIKLDIDVAIPLGLILNELISNAYKYAFEGRGEGQISVELKRIEDKLQLSVADNGRGLPVDFSLDKAKSLGLKLVNILTRQLNGELSVHSEGGTHFSILISDFKV